MDTAGSLPYINAVWLQALTLQIIRLVAALTDFNANDLIILQHIANKHGYIRSDCVPHTICQTSIGSVHIVNPCGIALIVNANVNNAAVCVRKSDDFFVNFIR